MYHYTLYSFDVSNVETVVGVKRNCGTSFKNKYIFKVTQRPTFPSWFHKWELQEKYLQDLGRINRKLRGIRNTEKYSEYKVFIFPVILVKDSVLVSDPGD